ncbi:hypothetical protein [Sulfurimonas sp.]|uniref:hypothetical protein n=1 Tax=Sulfurimonas sp. TaxID=2022749 RepID=UPI0025E70BFC|nr:hypothetical protein [Sulfurimonas sp.]
MNADVRKKIGAEHKDAVADLVVNKMVDGIKTENLVIAVSSLFESKDEVEVFFLALQKGGLKSRVMSETMAAFIVSKKKEFVVTEKS